jgi:hypothetical protein
MNPKKTASSSTNIFDDLPALRPSTKATHRDELEKYLSTERELNIQDGLMWWYERKDLYPRLSRMAMDYLSIPGKHSLFVVNGFPCLNINLTATSVDVERTFSQGRLLLSHVRSRLSVQSTRALLCVGVWSVMGYVKDSDVKAAVVLPEVNGKEDELTEDWDSLN